jgi:hypothetical protein
MKHDVTPIPTAMFDAFMRAEVVNRESPLVASVLRKATKGRGIVKRRQLWNRQRG